MVVDVRDDVGDAVMLPLDDKDGDRDLVSTMAQWVLFLHVFAGLLTRVQANQPMTAEEGGTFNAKALSYVPAKQRK